ncbi:hypothetical protein SAMN05414139_05110 [Burkholderia sp. D7]|nr:hypothetical protein SAMN05414139_05110 [Burkholderia sp. D7]
MSELPLHPVSLAAALTTLFRYRLSTRIVTLSGVAQALVLSMIAIHAISRDLND